MNIDELLNEIGNQRYPHQIDVVDRVMAQVASKPYLQPVHRRNSWQRISAAIAAAAVLLLVVLNVAVFNSSRIDDEGMGLMIAQYNDYSQWNTVEEVAENPYDYFYEE